MKLVLTLLCRDEADILESMLGFHLEQGVDQIIATDNGSVDGSLEILQRFERSGQLTLLEEAEHTHDQAIWVSRMARMAAAMAHMKAMKLTVTNTVFATTCLTTPTTTSTTRLTVKQAVSCGWKKMVTAPMMAITVTIHPLTRTPTILQRQIVRPLDTCGWNLATMMKK